MTLDRPFLPGDEVVFVNAEQYRYDAVVVRGYDPEDGVVHIRFVHPDSPTALPVWPFEIYHLTPATKEP